MQSLMAGEPRAPCGLLQQYSYLARPFCTVHQFCGDCLSCFTQPDDMRAAQLATATNGVWLESLKAIWRLQKCTDYCSVVTAGAWQCIAATDAAAVVQQAVEQPTQASTAAQ